jgi:cell division protein ZapA (FtsZ GTPase activity inhibitor)
MQQALTSMQGILTAEEANQLQGEIAQLNAAVSLQEAQATAQNQLFTAIANNNYNLWYEQPGNHPTY